jgi:hypothetical protein
VKLVNVGKYPDGYEYPYGDIEAFDEYDSRALEERGVQEAYYWYANGGYEGTGWILYKQADKWGLSSLGHCSCNSPLDDLDVARFESLDDLLVSDEARSEIADLVKAARA